MKIGIIGAGNIGFTVGQLWIAAGHEIRFGSRNPQTLQQNLRARNVPASASFAVDAAAFGEVVFTAVPYGAWPALVREIGNALDGKLVMDAANPYPARDGEFARIAIFAGNGAGEPIAALIPRANLVRAFSAVHYELLRTQAHRTGDQIGIPIAGDDGAALALAQRLVRDAGFEPVVTGDLSTAVLFDPGAAMYNTGLSAGQLREKLSVIIHTR